MEKALWIDMLGISLVEVERITDSAQLARYVEEIREGRIDLYRVPRDSIEIEVEWQRVARPLVERPEVQARRRGVLGSAGGQILPVTEEEAEELLRGQQHLDELKQARREGERAGHAWLAAERALEAQEFDLAVVEHQAGTPGECGRDERARVRVTARRTGVVVELVLRNLFDVGLVVNAVVEHQACVLINGTWTGESGQVRAATEAEKQAVRHARRHGPVSSGIRM